MENVYVVFDRVSGTRTGGIVSGRSHAPIIRSFHDALANDPQMKRHAGDYDLRCVGVIDDEGGICGKDFEVVATGASWIASQDIQPVQREA